jgi:hypothetical protein
MRLKTITNEQLLQAAKSNHSYAAIMRSLRIKPSEGNWRSLKVRMAELNIDTSNWKGSHHGTGGTKPKPLVLAANTPLTSPDRFKKQLIAKGILNNQCAVCRLSPFWNQQPLSLQLDHIDGDRDNQTISNLRLLCPNCHSQTPNFAGKALRKPRSPCPKCSKPLSKKAKICSECRWK